MGMEIKDGDNDITAEPGAFGAVKPAEPVQDLEEGSGVVAYKGQATIRRITKEQWEGAGVLEQDTVEWNSGNNFEVSLDELTPSAQRQLRQDGSFAFPANAE